MIQNELNHNVIKDFSRKIHLSSALIFIVYYLTIFYGVHYPYSLGFVQMAVAILFAISCFWLNYTTLHLVIALIAPIFYFIQLYLLTHIPVLEILVPFYKDKNIIDTNGVDINRAIDSARQGTIYIWTFLMAFYLCQEKEIRQLFSTSIGILGGLILILAIIAPRENTNVLWFYAIPTLIDGWGSFDASIEQTANFGFIWNYKIGNFEIFYPIKQVSTTILGPVFNENQFSALLGILLPITLFKLKVISQNKLLNYTLISIASGIAIFLLAAPAHSRGGVLSLFATFISLIAMQLLPNKRICILLFGTFMAAFISLYIAEFYGTITDTITSGRLLKWHDTLGIFKHAVVTGNGVGSIQSTGLFVELHHPWLKDGIREWEIWYATHNVYLEWLAEHGIYGFSCLLGAIYIFIRWTEKSKFPTPTIDQLPILLSLTFVVFYSALDYSPSKHYTALTIAVLIGWLIALRSQPKVSTVVLNNKLVSLMLKTIIILIALSNILSATRFIHTEHVIKELNSAIAPIFKTKRYFDESSKQALHERKTEIKTRLSQAELHFQKQRPDNRLAQSIARTHFILSEGKDKEELDLTYNWLLIDVKISSNNFFNNMMLNQFNRLNQTKIHKDN